MKWTGLNELREKYLSFFESKGHLRLASASLLPSDDKSLLLINAGMAPLKKYFSGQAVPPCPRVTSCQKCIRTPDIERVGITARHGTYFEMLGNFSFGDYFKTEALTWSWEFCTKVLEMPADRLWATIYENDDEAFEIWTKVIGMPEDHIVRLGKEDNFWEIGSGPCGPCSEIYFDRGPEYGCGSPDCKPGCDCDRFMEFWNNVFTQFDSDGHGNYETLAKKNIDTGMGLERLACIFQGVDSLFEVDTVRRILDHVCRIANIEYHNNDKNDISIRVITDHIRSTTFMICDGILPSNEGRGYVLRRLLRRAARHGRLLGINRPFLTEICDTVIAENKDAYPELVGRADYIKRVISEEEKRFYNTIEGGMQLLDALFEQMQANGKTVFDGANAFKLYDTYGFPIDLTREIAEEKGYTIDMDTFTALMNKQKETARNARNASTNEGWVTNEAIAVQPATEYLGYDNDTCAANVLAILSGNGTAESAMEDEQVALILDRTVCYAESGGQVGSKGTIRTESGIFTVTGCQKAVGGQYIHSGYVESGMISCGAATCTVDTASAAATRRNHTSVHLLQAALRKVLGDHVHQAGSYVDDSRLRLDFSHFSAVTPEQLVEIENIVNDAIAASLPVETKVMPIEEAKKTGAMALFGEKYGDFVRVVDVKDFSVEFCGGTHIDNTAKIGLFKILYESSVAAGVRRIEAVTGRQILDLIRREQSLIRESGELLKLKNTSELPNKIASMLEDNKAREHAFDKMRSAMAELQASTLYTNIVNICGVSLITTRLDDSDSAMMRELAERLTTATPPKKFVDLVDKKLVIVLGGVCDGKGAFAVACSKDAVAAGLKAGDIAREVAKIAGGNGGGRPDFAMAGAKEINLIDRALDAVDGIISSKLQ